MCCGPRYIRTGYPLLRNITSKFSCLKQHSFLSLVSISQGFTGLHARRCLALHWSQVRSRLGKKPLLTSLTCSPAGFSSLRTTRVRTLLPCWLVNGDCAHFSAARIPPTSYLASSKPVREREKGLALRWKSQTFVTQPLDVAICHGLEASYSRGWRYMRPWTPRGGKQLEGHLGGCLPELLRNIEWKNQNTVLVRFPFKKNQKHIKQNYIV